MTAFLLAVAAIAAISTMVFAVIGVYFAARLGERTLSVMWFAISAVFLVLAGGTLAMATIL